MRAGEAWGSGRRWQPEWPRRVTPRTQAMRGQMRQYPQPLCPQEGHCIHMGLWGQEKVPALGGDLRLRPAWAWLHDPIS